MQDVQVAATRHPCAPLGTSCTLPPQRAWSCCCIAPRQCGSVIYSTSASTHSHCQTPMQTTLLATLTTAMPSQVCDQAQRGAGGTVGRLLQLGRCCRLLVDQPRRRQLPAVGSGGRAADRALQAAVRPSRLQPELAADQASAAARILLVSSAWLSTWSGPDDAMSCNVMSPSSCLFVQGVLGADRHRGAATGAGHAVRPAERRLREGLRSRLRSRRQAAAMADAAAAIWRLRKLPASTIPASSILI